MLPSRDAFAVLCALEGADIFPSSPLRSWTKTTPRLLSCEEELANGMARAFLGEVGSAADLDEVGRPVIDS
jgi:hypothetical protein